jgi:hypothetical protein
VPQAPVDENASRMTAHVREGRLYKGAA